MLSVVVANIGDIGIKQSYDNTVIVDIENHISPPEFFNEVYNKHPNGDIFIFLPDGYEFITKNALERITHKLVEYPSFSGVYTDAYINNDGSKSRVFLPAYSETIVKQNSINMPIAFRKKCCPIFDKRIKHMFFSQVLTLVSHRFTFCHIADTLFSIDLTGITPQIIQEDIKIIKSFQ